MDDAELCRAVATEVMGWTAVQYYENTPVLFFEGRVTGENERWLAPTGNDALRVIERMNSMRVERYDAWGCKVDIVCVPQGVDVSISVPWGMSQVTLGAASEDTLPRAVFEAALAAKRSQNNG